MAEQKLPKLTTGVRFPSPAPGFRSGDHARSISGDAVAPPPSVARGRAAQRLTAKLMLLVAALCLGAAAAPAAERYPVWWSPALQLDSLDRLEARLSETAPIEGMKLTKGYPVVEARAVVTDCNSLLRLTAEEYYARGYTNYGLMRLNTAWCGALAAFRMARPARVSHVRDFVFDARAPAVLPAMVVLDANRTWLCARHVANQRGTSLARFEYELTVEVRGPLEMKLLTSWLDVDLSIVGRADFDGDGREDLLVISNAGGIGGIWTGGTWSATDYFILSRAGPHQVMRVVEADRRLRPDYGCYPPYDPAPVTERYPVSWSPALQLDSLDRLEARLSEPAPIEGMKLVKGYPVVEARAVVTDCNSLLRLKAEGYEARGNQNYRLVLFNAAWCGALAAFRTARPARVSYVRNFVFDARAPAVLPAMVFPAPGCDWLCRQHMANARGIPLGRFESENIAVEAKGPFGVSMVTTVFDEVSMVTSVFDVSLRILGRADFDGDGREDLLVFSSLSFVEGHGGISDYFVLSRAGPDEVMRVVGADGYLCGDYTCPASYDHPPALGEPD